MPTFLTISLPLITFLAFTFLLFQMILPIFSNKMITLQHNLPLTAYLNLPLAIPQRILFLINTAIFRVIPILCYLNIHTTINPLLFYLICTKKFRLILMYWLSNFLNTKQRHILNIRILRLIKRAI